MENIIDKILKLTEENKIEWNVDEKSLLEDYKCYINNIYIKATKTNYPSNIYLELHHINCSTTLESIRLDIDYKNNRNPEYKSKGYKMYEAIKDNIDYHICKYVKQSYELINKIINGIYNA
jgi:tRNA U54 and U55 pseudouridine synthase Pus10